MTWMENFQSPECSDKMLPLVHHFNCGHTQSAGQWTTLAWGLQREGGDWWTQYMEKKIRRMWTMRNEDGGRILCDGQYIQVGIGAH